MYDVSLVTQRPVANEWTLSTLNEAFLKSLPLLSPVGLCQIDEIVLIHIFDEESPLALGKRSTNRPLTETHSAEAMCDPWRYVGLSTRCNTKCLEVQ